MQPKTDAKISEKDFNILKRTIKNIAVSKRERETKPEFATFLPDSVGIKLTNRCNLRCKHCYQWNESGYHHFMDKNEQCEEMDYKIFEKIISETDESKSRLYIWGGEPLYYSGFDKVADLLECNPRETAICTNATLIEKSLDSILKISDNLELLIGLDGFKEENDSIRGAGVFAKAVDAVELLVKLRGKGIFKGKISVHTVINDFMAGKLYDFIDFMEDIGVDMVMICFPWYISEECSERMDLFFTEQFGFLQRDGMNREKSWHSFKYRLNYDKLETLLQEFSKINKRVWKLRIRYQPALEQHQIEDFILGKELYENQNKKCLALSNRMDINADGCVSACKFFSEFIVGDLKNSSVEDIWHCEKYNKIREVLNNSLMPVCSKCSVLHLHSI